MIEYMRQCMSLLATSVACSTNLHDSVEISENLLRQHFSLSTTSNDNMKCCVLYANCIPDFHNFFHHTWNRYWMAGKTWSSHKANVFWCGSVFDSWPLVISTMHRWPHWLEFWVKKTWTLGPNMSFSTSFSQLTGDLNLYLSMNLSEKGKNMALADKGISSFWGLGLQ